jgi:S1-C subfamily serine protease
MRRIRFRSVRMALAAAMLMASPEEGIIVTNNHVIEGPTRS